MSRSQKKRRPAINWRRFTPTDFEYDFMKAKRKTKILSEEAIDKLVVAQAEDDSAWEKPISVRKTKSTSILLSAELAARAAFFARLHRQARVEDWLTQIVRERIELEEAAFAVVKRNLVKANT